MASHGLRGNNGEIERTYIQMLSKSINRLTSNQLKIFEDIQQKNMDDK